MLYTASVDCIVKLDCMFVIARQAVWHCMYISIWYGPRVNLIYVTSTKTSSHNFLCHKHAIIPQKRFHFHFLGHKHVQTILAKSLLSDASVACCFHCILKDSRILLQTAISFECCIKTRIWRYPLPVCNSQCSHAKCSGIKNKASIPSSQLLLRLLERTSPKKSGRGNFILKSVCP